MKHPNAEKMIKERMSEAGAPASIDPKDLLVVDAWINRRSARGATLITDGETIFVNKRDFVARFVPQITVASQRSIGPDLMNHIMLTAKAHGIPATHY